MKLEEMVLGETYVYKPNSKKRGLPVELVVTYEGTITDHRDPNNKIKRCKIKARNRQGYLHVLPKFIYEREEK